ncbi:MAG: glycosyltransferase family 9 protein [Bacteroidota bacterium]
MKILILRFSSIGDIVLTTPVVRCLKKKYPDAEIHYATKKSFHLILKHNTYLTQVYLLEDSLMHLVRELKKEKFDYVIDLHNNQRTFLIKLLLGVKSFSFNKINFKKWLMVNLKINRLPDKHIVDRYLETVESLGVENDGEGLDYFLSKEDNVDLKTLPTEFHNNYIGWVIGAKHNTKKIPEDKIFKTIDQFNYPVVILGGKEDEEAGNQIIKSSGANRQMRVFNACGKFSLNQSASLVQQAKFIITNDTGLMHIAAAFKKPIISIWGSTIPEFGMSPYGTRNLKLETANLSCRPCSKLGYDACPKGHFKCMNLINENSIVDEIEKEILSG